MKYIAWVYCFIATVIIALDQITKQLAIKYCYAERSITSFLSFEVAYNHGISWGIGNTQHSFVSYAALLVTLLVTCALLVYIITKIMSRQSALLEVIIFAGAFSNNVIDRLFRGGVVDFIHFFYNAYSFPLFNIADICIVIGITLLCLHTLSDKQ